MLAHMGVVAIAAPLLALGLPAMPALLGPAAATLVEFVLVWGWHAPALRAAAEGSVLVTAAEQASFLAAGLLLWTACLRRRHGRCRRAPLHLDAHDAARRAPRARAPAALRRGDGQLPRPHASGPPPTRASAARVMLAVGAVVYLAGGLALVARSLEPGPMRLRRPPPALCARSPRRPAALVAWLGIVASAPPRATGRSPTGSCISSCARRSGPAALGEPVPDPLPREALRPAAGHYARGCAICHGAPGEPRSPAVARRCCRTARPRRTRRRLDRRRTPPHRHARRPLHRDAGLAGPGARGRGLDDGRLPSRAARPRPPEATRPCTAHRRAPFRPTAAAATAPDGREGGPHVPILAGQSEAYLARQPRRLRRGPARERHHAAGRLRPRARGPRRPRRPPSPRCPPRNRPGRPPPPRKSPHAAAQSTAVPACLACHGEPRRNPAFPRLDGQPAPYLAAQLRLFRDAARGGGPYAGVMTSAAGGLTDADITALAAWFAAR